MASSRDRESFRRDRRERSRSRDRSKRSRSRERNRNDDGGGGGGGGDRNYRNDRNINRRGDDDRRMDRNYGGGDRKPTDTDCSGGGFILGGDNRTSSPNTRGLDDGSDPKRQKTGRNENHGSRRENERFDRTRIEDGGRQNFDRGMWNRNGADDLEGNTNNYDDRRGQPRFNREYVSNRRFGDSGYGQRGSVFGRRGFNRYRGGRGGGTTVVYRPGEEDDKPKLNLFNPTDVPKGRSYFEHDDRAAGARIGRGRGRGNFGPRLNRNNFNSQEQTSSTDCWSHDMFKMEEEEKIEQQS